MHKWNLRVNTITDLESKSLSEFNTAGKGRNASGTRRTSLGFLYAQEQRASVRIGKGNHFFEKLVSCIV
jgi:hypothetical protein